MRGAPLPKLLGIPTPILPPTAVAAFLWRWFLNTTHSNTHGGNGLEEFQPSNACWLFQVTVRQPWQHGTTTQLAVPAMNFERIQQNPWTHSIHSQDAHLGLFTFHRVCPKPVLVPPESCLSVYVPWGVTFFFSWGSSGRLGQTDSYSVSLASVFHLLKMPAVTPCPTDRLSITLALHNNTCE